MLDLRKLKPINGQVVVVDDPKEEKSGSILLPETITAGRLIRGTILAESSFLLENGTYETTGLSVGDKVVYGNLAGAGNINEQDKLIYRIVRWNEILGIEVK